MKVDRAVKGKNNLMFLSFDEGVYYNPNAFTFNYIIPEPIPLMKGKQDLEAITKMALERSPFIEGNRNNSIHMVASCMNYYGVSIKQTMFHLMKTFNFNRGEIMRAAKSAYKRTDQFGKGNRQSVNNDKTTLGGTPYLPESITDVMPEHLQRTIKMYEDRKRDVFTLSTLGLISGCLGNTHFYYGSKLYYSNIYTLIIAPPASGKGAIENVKAFGMRINSKLYTEFQAEKAHSGEDDPDPILKSLIIAGNASAAGRIEDMSNNSGNGIVMESEADTISASNKQDWGDTSYMERQAFEHESIQIRRKNEKISIPTPKLSIVVAGTPNQVKPYLESAENGLFSRYSFYLYEVKNEWKDQFAIADTGIGDKLNHTADFISDLHDYYRAYSFRLIISEECRSKFNSLFRKKCDELSPYDVEVASLRRLGVITVRNAMILTALREFDIKSGKAEIQCDEDIWNASLELMGVLYEHMIKAIALVGGNVSPKERLYNSLPMKFNVQDAHKIGEQHGISRRTVERRLKVFINEQKLIKVSHGIYSKPNG